MPNAPDRPVTVADLISALQQFPPDAPVGSYDPMTCQVLYMVAPVLDSDGVVVVGTGDRYTGVVGQHYCDQTCSPYCEL